MELYILVIIGTGTGTHTRLNKYPLNCPLQNKIFSRNVLGERGQHVQNAIHCQSAQAVSPVRRTVKADDGRNEKAKTHSHTNEGKKEEKCKTNMFDKWSVLITHRNQTKWKIIWWKNIIVGRGWHVRQWDNCLQRTVSRCRPADLLASHSCNIFVSRIASMRTNSPINHNFAIACGVKMEKGKPAASGFGAGKPWLVASGVFAVCVCASHTYLVVCFAQNWIDRMTLKTTVGTWFTFTHANREWHLTSKDRVMRIERYLYTHHLVSRSLSPSVIMHFVSSSFFHFVRSFIAHVIGATVREHVRRWLVMPALHNSESEAAAAPAIFKRLWQFIVMLWLLFAFLLFVNRR